MSNFGLKDFFETEGFKSLDAESKSLLKEFSEKAVGKPKAEAMAVFMEYHSKLNKPGKIDAEKRKVLIDAMKTGLTPLERKKLEIFEQMLAKQ